MRDPLLIDEGEKRIPDEWRTSYRATYRETFENRAPEKVSKDLVAAFDKIAESFDRIAELQKEKNLLLSEVIVTKKKLRWANRNIWLMGLIVSPIVGELVKKLLHWIFG